MALGTAATQIRADGRVTVPADLRRRLGLEQGDYVVIKIRPIETDGNDG